MRVVIPAESSPVYRLPARAVTATLPSMRACSGWIALPAIRWTIGLQNIVVRTLALQMKAAAESIMAADRAAPVIPKLCTQRHARSVIMATPKVEVETVAVETIEFDF